MRSRHEIVVFDDDVAHRRNGHVLPQRLPAQAIVERHVDGPLGRRKQQALLLRILTTALTVSPAGIPDTISVHVAPSCVPRMCGRKSSSRSVLIAA